MGSSHSRKQSFTAGEVFDKFDEEIQRGVEESQIHGFDTFWIPLIHLIWSLFLLWFH